MMLHHPAEMLHYTTALLIALAVLVVVVLAVRLIVGSPGADRHRVRILRWRIRLYLRPGRLREHLRARGSLVTAPGGPDRRPFTAIVAVVGAATPARDRVRGASGPGALRRRVIASMEDQAVVVAAREDRQVRVVSGPDHRSSWRGRGHHLPDRLVPEHRCAVAA
jgi:hypothetical protein